MPVLLIGTLSLALVGGLLAKLVKLPPLIGFLVVGYVMYGLGVRSTPEMQLFGNLGVTALLFTIGLKLHLKSLIGRQVMGVGLLHMLLWTGFSAAGIMGLKTLGLAALKDITWPTAGVLGLALAFSSTVFVVKVLDSRGQQQSRYGAIAIGILVIQDIVAVTFMSLTAPTAPSLAALALLFLPALIPVLRWLLHRVGHGELLVLTGFVLAFGGYWLFALLGLKGDLGALVAGVMIAQTPQAVELYRRLKSVKGLLLIAFFVDVGLQGLPSRAMLGVALIFLAVLPFKSALYLLLFRFAGGKPRIHAMSAATLTNYSEFALVVCAVSAGSGILDPVWVSVMAIALAGSFLGSAFVFRFDHLLLEWLIRVTAIEERMGVPAEKAEAASTPSFDFSDVDAVVLGMGRIGRGAYRQLYEAHDLRVRGVETDPGRVSRLRALGADIVEGDAVDPELWEAIDNSDSVSYVLASMPLDDDDQDNESLFHQFARHRLGQNKPNGEPRTYRTVVATRYGDQRERLLAEGADAVIYVYQSAGAELADLAVTPEMDEQDEETARFD